MAAVLVIHTALEVHLLCVRAYVHGPRAPATLLRMPLMLTATATAAADRALATFK